MMIDGQKMACLACIRGHRVSGCNHTERDLLPIAKKGRPVSQCQHCRQLRKSRSTHVKCECATLAAAKKAREDQQRQLGLIHPEKSDTFCCSSTTTANGAVAGLTATAPGSQHAGVAVPPPSAAAAATTGDGSDSKSGGHSSPSSSSNDVCQCCSGAGNRCICALKTENSSTNDLMGAIGGHHSLDAISEFFPDSSPTMLPHPPASEPSMRVPKAKPRLTATHSDTALTTFHNGHHKPTHKHHSSIHGASPYSIPTVGHTGHTFGEHEGCHKVQHSQWDLHSGSSNNGACSAPPTLTHRRIKSEHSSPDLRTYAGIPMNTANTNGPNLITPLELTPRPQPPVQPVRPSINRTPSGRIQTGLSVVTNHDFGALHNFMAPPASAGPTSAVDTSHMPQFSADLFPSSAAGWPMTHNWESLTTAAPSNQYMTPTAPPSSVGDFQDQHAYPISNMSDSTDYFERLRMFPPPLTNSTSGDDDGYDHWHNPSPPPYSSGIAISNADSDHFADDQCWNNHAYSAQSSVLNLPSLAEGPIGYEGQMQQQQQQGQQNYHSQSHGHGHGHRHRPEKPSVSIQPVDLWIPPQPPTPSVEDPFSGGVLINAADVVTSGGEWDEPGYLVMPHHDDGAAEGVDMGGMKAMMESVREVYEMVGGGGGQEQEQGSGVAERNGAGDGGMGMGVQVVDEYGWINGAGVSEMWLN